MSSSVHACVTLNKSIKNSRRNICTGRGGGWLLFYHPGADRWSMVPDSGGNSRHSLQPRVTETSWFLGFHTWKDSDKHAQRLCEPLVCLRYQMNKDSRQLQVKRRIWSEDWWWWGHNSHYREDNPDERGIKWRTVGEALKSTRCSTQTTSCYQQTWEQWAAARP